MGFCLALRMVLLLLSGVLAPAVLTGKGAPSTLLPPATQGQEAPRAGFSTAHRAEEALPSQKAEPPFGVVLWKAPGRQAARSRVGVLGVVSHGDDGPRSRRAI